MSQSMKRVFNLDNRPGLRNSIQISICGRTTERLNMRLIMTCTYLWISFCFEAQAQTAVYDQLYSALRLDEIVQIIKSEGTDEANTTAKIYLKSKGQTETFRKDIEKLYDRTNISTFLLDGVANRLTEDDAQSALVFYSGSLGATIAQLEASARLAISDDAVESVAIEIAKAAGSKDHKRYKTLMKNIEELELVEHNMKGAFASQYGFLTELSQADDIDLSQDQILSMLSGNEQQLREEISAWLMGYSYMAYQPLSDEELDVYFDFLASTSGKALNKALFDVFNALSVEIASALGVLIAASREARDL